MTTLWTVLIFFAYIFVGGVITGIITDDFDTDGERSLVFIFWPLLIVAAIMYCIVIGPVKLGEKIRERFDK